jgi:hypothetical protein
MARNIEQHHAFMPGLQAFETYVKSCFDEKNKETYNSKTFQKHIESFAPILSQHLNDEIVTLLGLESCDTVAVKKAFVEFDLKMREGDKVCLVSANFTDGLDLGLKCADHSMQAILFPLVMGSSDASYEGEPLWPEVPGPVRYLIHYYFERKYRSVWRFCPSDTWGVRREFAFSPETSAV